MGESFALLVFPFAGMAIGGFTASITMWGIKSCLLRHVPSVAFAEVAAARLRELAHEAGCREQGAALMSLGWGAMAAGMVYGFVQGYYLWTTMLEGGGRAMPSWLNKTLKYAAYASVGLFAVGCLVSNRGNATVLADSAVQALIKKISSTS